MKAGYELESDYADTARYYKELGAQESDIKTEREQLYKKLKDALFAMEAKEAVAGEYAIKISAYERDKIDKAKVPEEAITKVPAERLSVSVLKVKRGKEEAHA